MKPAEVLEKEFTTLITRHGRYGYTVVILINATTLMHKSTLSTNNFGNNHFGQKYQRQNILRIFRRL